MSNLIKNPSFNNVHRHYYQGSDGFIYDADEVECNNDGCHVKGTEIEANLISELQIPSSWDITWQEGENPLPDGWPLLRPEINNGNIEQLPATPITWDDRYNYTTERELFADGGKYLKVFKGNGALDWQMLSDSISIEIGKKYTIVFRVFPDLVTGYTNDNKKVWATDRPGDVKLETNFHDGEWVEIVAGEWNEVGLTFVATQDTSMFITLSARCRWAIKNNGWFLDTVSMYEVPNTDIPEPPRIKQTIHLVPQDTTQVEMDWLTRELAPMKSAFTYSADLAHAIVYAGNDESKVVVWSGGRWQDNIYDWLDSRNIPYELREFPKSI